MACTPPSYPETFSQDLLTFNVSDLERRFLLGWWTRGLIPADNFVTTNWAGLIIPDSITFDQAEIIIKYRGRWWDNDGCPQSLPPTVVTVTGLCHTGRVQIYTHVKYGKKETTQLYIGHNGLNKLDHDPLYNEKMFDACSVERTAAIPFEQRNSIDIAHFLDWITALTTVAPVIGIPGDFWVNALADYALEDFKFAPCIGCEFPIDYSTAPNIIENGWNQRAIELVAKDAKALYDAIVSSSIPSSFAVPICPTSFWLDVSLPEFTAMANVRLFDDCTGLNDSLYMYPVTSLETCFIFDQPIWPAADDPRWEPQCLPEKTKSCFKYYGGNTQRKPSPNHPDYNQIVGFHDIYSQCGTYKQLPGNAPWVTPSGMVTLYYATVIYMQENMIVPCTFNNGGYYGGGEIVTEERCVRVYENIEIIHGSELVHESKYGDRRTQLYQQNAAIYYDCDAVPNTSGGTGSNSPPAPLAPPEPPPDPRGNGDCFLEGEFAYNLDITTILGRHQFRATKSFRVKIPSGVQLGPISAQVSGNTLNIGTSVTGTYSVDISSIIEHYNNYAATVTSILPVSFGLQNVRRICP